MSKPTSRRQQATMLVALGSFCFMGSLYDLFVHHHPLSGVAVIAGIGLVLVGLPNAR